MTLRPSHASELRDAAVTAGVLYGLLTIGPTTTVGFVERERPPSAPTTLVVGVDDGGDVTSWVSALVGAALPAGFAAFFVASATLVGLAEVTISSRSAEATKTNDPYRCAVSAVAPLATSSPLPVATSVARLRALIEEAHARGLVLVEPEGTPPIKDPAERAIVATVLHGEAGRPLFFAPRARAPKHGLAKVRSERVLDAILTARGAIAKASNAPADLVGAALAILTSAGPLHGKELLRAARDRWITDARSEGRTASPSTGDAPALARAIVSLWRTGAVRVSFGEPR